MTGGQITPEDGPIFGRNPALSRDTMSSQRTILIVDDEQLVCDSVRVILEMDGHRVQTATSAREALAMVAKEHFDLIIVDYVMPEMRGDALARELRSQEPTRPILLMTALSHMLDSKDGIFASANLVIGKPFSLNQLRDSVATLLPGQ